MWANAHKIGEKLVLISVSYQINIQNYIHDQAFSMPVRMHSRQLKNNFCHYEHKIFYGNTFTTGLINAGPFLNAGV